MAKTETTILSINKPTRVSFILKLNRLCREKFKVATRKQRTTMQAMIEAFINSYIEDPSRFKISVNVQMEYIDKDKPTST